MSTVALLTAEQLAEMPNGERYELIAGELKEMTPAGWKHGNFESLLDRRLGAYVEEHGLGIVLTGDPGFVIARDPDTVRAPDIAFIRRERVETETTDSAFWNGPPDLAVEIVSPGDTLREIDDKVHAWLDAGALAVWVVSPRWRSVTVYRSATNIKTLTEKDELTGEEIIPGFRCPVRELFGGL